MTHEYPPPKIEKRIDALIKAGRSATILMIVGLFIPVVTAIGPLIGFGYAAEISKLIKKYPDYPLVPELLEARSRLKLMGIVLGAWLVSWVIVFLVFIVQG